MELASLGMLCAFSLFVGFLIGCIGIGGVLLVPFLTYVLGFDVYLSIAAAMFGYIFAGIIGAIIYARQGSIEWSKALWMVLGAMPAAYFGSFLVSIIPALELELLIATLVFLAGVRALKHTSVRAREQASVRVRERDTLIMERRISNPLALIIIGSITGAGSALTGTGGPMIAVPILVSLKVSAHSAIGFSQAMQAPIASLATIGNVFFGTINLPVGATLAGGLVFGGYFGARLAHTIEPTTMSRLVAWVLIIVGILLIGNLSISLL